ncbi:unnamed protein product [Periconia digitata]|uniref:BAH domain-containing protein n=1 Tax=Periconia digitata TaxID=1303443 RepID=A0A9W4U4L9_9PLEO|nr:unnamed protein product [Periconia digitata]
MPRKRRSASAATTSGSKGTKRKRGIDWDTISEDNGFAGFKLRPMKQPKKPQPGFQEPTKDYNHMSMEAVVAQANPFPDTDLGPTYFRIAPKPHWESPSFKRYAKFTVETHHYHVGDIVHIRHDADESTLEAPIENWLAKVLEIRGANSNNVYLRIYWMYRPEDLPGGRRPYHGKNELIATNDMDILHARTVNGLADVIQWTEDRENTEILDPVTLFWRQTFDVSKRPHLLSQLPKHCIDNTPWNPDEPLVQCGSCHNWLHASCLQDAAVRKLYKEHNLAYPEPTKGKGAKNAQPAAAFQAQVEVTESSLTYMNITDKRVGPTKDVTTKTPIYCLLCNAPVDETKAEMTNVANDEPASAGIHVNSSHLTPATPPTMSDGEDSGKDIAKSSPELSNPHEEPSRVPTGQTATEQSLSPILFSENNLRTHVESFSKLFAP